MLYYKCIPGGKIEFQARGKAKFEYNNISYELCNSVIELDLIEMFYYSVSLKCGCRTKKNITCCSDSFIGTPFCLGQDLVQYKIDVSCERTSTVIEENSVKCINHSDPCVGFQVGLPFFDEVKGWVSMNWTKRAELGAKVLVWKGQTLYRTIDVSVGADGITVDHLESGEFYFEYQNMGCSLKVGPRVILRPDCIFRTPFSTTSFYDYNDRPSGTILYCWNYEHDGIVEHACPECNRTTNIPNEILIMSKGSDITSKCIDFNSFICSSVNWICTGGDTTTLIEFSIGERVVFGEQTKFIGCVWVTQGSRRKCWKEFFWKGVS